MRTKLLGSVFLITGTSIGAGMLGLPIASAQLGFVGSVVLLLTCWSVMLISAFLILEVNLWLPQNNNLISMAKATIGPLGQGVAWIAYLLLMYSLLCAYIDGGSHLFQVLLVAAGLNLPLAAASMLFTLIFGAIVYLGIRSVDQVNRGLMLVKFSTFFILVFLLMPFISLNNIATGNLYYLTSVSAITVTATSFGWATLIPSLRIYFAGDIKKLKKAIIIGSTIPLICYIIWDAAIMGVLPLSGEHSLIAILNSSNSTGSLVSAISTTIGTSSVTFLTRLFTSICVLTSFLGVALCLTDFLADGLRLEKKGTGNIVIHAITFIPALCIAILFPNIFIRALGYAGIYCAVLLVLLPAWMTWRGRYNRHIAQGFSVFGGKITLGLLIVLSIMFIMHGLVN